jgi:glutathione S-transferase
MALTIYGSPRSRTMRVLWIAAELGLAYEHVPLAWDDPALKAPDFLKLNPAGTIPVIDDDGLVVSESMAICLYLAKAYGADGPAPLYPRAPRDEAEVWRWSLWAQGHLEPWVQRDMRMNDLRAAANAAVTAMTAEPLALLDRVLSKRDWLVGGHFTVADFNVCSVLSPSRTAALDLSPHATLRRWLARCHGRPAALAARARFQA